jgi:methyl-accepting chemotaxis protein-2 (aspartate sensor receptor)
MAAKTGESMNRIDASTREVSAVVEEISNTLREQNAASKNITMNVDKIAQMIVYNGTTDRAVSQLASGLEQLAARLEASLGKFKV